MLRRAAMVSAIGLFGMAAIYMLAWASLIFIPFTVAIMVGLTLAPIAKRMRRWLPPYLVSLMLLVAMLGFTAILFVLLSIPAQQWSARLPEIEIAFRNLLVSLRGSFEAIDQISKTVEEARTAVEGGSDVPARAAEQQRFSLIKFVFSSVPMMVSQVVLFIGGFYFFTANWHRMRRTLLWSIKSQQHRRTTARMLRNTERFLYRYVAAIMVVNFGLGVVTGLAMYALGLPSPELWGALAAILNFIPYLGPAVVTAVLGGVGLITFDEISLALIPAGIFVTLNIIESQFVTPAVLGNTLTLNPLMVFFSIAFWAWIWGPIGAFLAVPILIMATVASAHLLMPRARPEPVSPPALE